MIVRKNKKSECTSPNLDCWKSDKRKHLNATIIFVFFQFARYTIELDPKLTGKKKESVLSKPPFPICF